MPQWIHRFGSGMAAVGDLDPDVVGLKGAGLARAARAGLSVPPGFTLSTAACRAYHDNGGALPTELRAALDTALRSIEAATGRRLEPRREATGERAREGARVRGGGVALGARSALGTIVQTLARPIASRAGPAAPLVLAVRPSTSGSASVPGMMASVQGLGRRGDEGDAGGDANADAAAEASFLRAMGADEGDVEEALAEAEPNDALAGIRAGLDAARSGAGAPPLAPPDAPRERLVQVLGAAFDAWEGPRARAYRAARPGCGLAVTVQAMVECVTPEIAMMGAARTRHAETGERGLRGFWAPGGGSVRTAPDVRRLAAREATVADGGEAGTLERTDPDLLAKIESAGRVLERAETRPVDIQFAIGADASLWVLNASHAPLGANAAIRSAVDMVGEGLIDRREALLRTDPNSLDQILHARIAPDAARRPFGRGTGAAPGAATGEIALTTARVLAMRDEGRPAILVCTETGPDDIAGIQVAEGVVTTRGGLTSHAAVIARGLGRPCVTGAAGLHVDARARTVRSGEVELDEGAAVTLDGTTGEVLLGRAPLVPPEMGGHFATLMEWADDVRRLRVRANADTPADAALAREFGAEGIGLCRTEHMMVDPSRATPMREMILAEDEAARRAALAKLLPLQRADFAALFETMAGLPVMIRLLDPPLHEFLPKSADEMRRAAQALGVPLARLRERVGALRETNPMLGHRGCRLAISYPEIARMQVRAILEAAGEVNARAGREGGGGIDPEIMVPLVALLDELDYVKGIVDEEAAAVTRETGRRVRYRVGTMIELPRAALRADDIARTAEFFSFGTNDLTQTTFGISRDDASPFLRRYRELGLMGDDPFATIDRRGVGRLVRVACEMGREVRPDIALSICGEHGGDPASIEFCEAIGLDYVSCSPYRVPVARLAAAQAAIRAR